MHWAAEGGCSHCGCSSLSDTCGASGVIHEQGTLCCPIPQGSMCQRPPAAILGLTWPCIFISASGPQQLFQPWCYAVGSEGPVPKEEVCLSILGNGSSPHTRTSPSCCFHMQSSREPSRAVAQHPEQDGAVCAMSFAPHWCPVGA